MSSIYLVARLAHSASNGSSIIALLRRDVFEWDEEEDGGRSREGYFLLEAAGS